MSSTIRYIVCVIAGVGICWIFMNRCTSQQTQSLIDSLKVEKALNDTLIVQTKQSIKKTDSIQQKKVVDSLVYTRKIDSQTRVIASLQGRLNVNKDSIKTLYANLKTFYLDHDTVALKETYERLSEQLTQANNMLFQVQLARDSADNLRNAEITRLNGVINTLQGQIHELQSLLKLSTDNASNINKTAMKALKKQKVAALISKVGIGLSLVLGIILVAHH